MLLGISPELFDYFFGGPPKKRHIHIAESNHCFDDITFSRELGVATLRGLPLGIASSLSKCTKVVAWPGHMASVCTRSANAHVHGHKHPGAQSHLRTLACSFDCHLTKWETNWTSSFGGFNKRHGSKQEPTTGKFHKDAVATMDRWKQPPKLANTGDLMGKKKQG